MTFSLKGFLLKIRFSIFSEHHHRILEAFCLMPRLSIMDLGGDVCGEELEPKIPPLISAPSLDVGDAPLMGELPLVSLMTLFKLCVLPGKSIRSFCEKLALRGLGRGGT